MEPKKVLVIGAGISGIASVANIKAEGMDPVCYERSDKFGGTWRYRKESRFGQASIMPTTVINHSKEMGSFSNFPPRKEFNNYMRHAETLEYFTEYVKHFDVERHIYYNMEVLHVKKSTDYDKTGKWTVSTRNSSNEEVRTETFDGIFVSTGHINMPKMPTFTGQDSFKGKIIHSHSLKEVEVFTNQSVVVVGSRCSALDAAVEISRVAKQVYLSTRSGGHVFCRNGRHGYPIDSTLFRRYLTFLMDSLPTNIVSWYLETYCTDALFDQNLYYSKPKAHLLTKEPILNDHIRSKLLSGFVIQKGNVEKFIENGVHFEGEDYFTEVDSVIMATGYTYGFPYLEEGILTKNDGIINLFKCIYPPHLPHPTLAFIGFINSFGPGFSIVELQTRWASYLLSGKGQLPTKEIMMKDIIKRHQKNVKRFGPQEKISIRVDVVPYMDEIAGEMGAKPNLFKYIFKDFSLFLQLLFGPCVSYQFRLDGHGKWEGARDAIMTVNDRIEWPLTRGQKMKKKSIFQCVIEFVVNLIPLNIYIWK